MKKLFKSVSDRWNAEETKLGKAMKGWFAWATGTVAIIGHLATEANVIAVQQWVSPNIFKFMAGCAIVSAFLGKMTKSSNA